GEPGGSAHARPAPPSVPPAATMHTNASTILIAMPRDGIVTRASRGSVVRVFIEFSGMFDPATPLHDVSEWSVATLRKTLRGGWISVAADSAARRTVATGLLWFVDRRQLFLHWPGRESRDGTDSCARSIDDDVPY